MVYFSFHHCITNTTIKNNQIIVFTYIRTFRYIRLPNIEIDKRGNMKGTIIIINN